MQPLTNILSVIIQAKYVISKSRLSKNRDFLTNLIVLELLPLGSFLYCGRHVSHNALVFSRSIGNKRQRATSLVRDC